MHSLVRKTVHQKGSVMHKKLSLPAALAIALCVAATADAGQQVTLRWHFEPGESLV